MSNGVLARTVLVACALCLSIPMILGVGCLEDMLFDAPPDPEPFWASVYSTSYLFAEETGTAGVDTNRAGDTLEYKWSITPPATLVGPDDGMTAAFTSSTGCSATLTVIVTDPSSNSSATSVTQVAFDGSGASDSSVLFSVEVTPDQTVAVGQTTVLYAAVNDWSIYVGGAWRQASGPLQTVVPEGALWTEAITVVGTTPGTAVFEFIAYTVDGQVVTRTVTVEVTGPNPG